MGTPLSRLVSQTFKLLPHLLSTFGISQGVRTFREISLCVRTHFAYEHGDTARLCPLAFQEPQGVQAQDLFDVFLRSLEGANAAQIIGRSRRMESTTVGAEQ